MQGLFVIWPTSLLKYHTRVGTMGILRFTDDFASPILGPGQTGVGSL